MNKLIALTLLSVCSFTLRGADLSADSSRGARAFESQGCGACHAVGGVGPSIGPDLASVADRGFTPASLAATMWNHAPQMWGETKLRNLTRPVLGEQESADLFAFFYSIRFFEQPGDAGRGKSLFGTRKCSTCHGLTAPVPQNQSVGAKPVKEWTAASDPLDLIETMWNHSNSMREVMARNNIRLPQLSGQELADLLVYVRSVQGLSRRTGSFRAASPDDGKALFESKGCAGCHDPVTRFFSIRLRDETLTDIASDMWNHGIEMSSQGILFEPGQMRNIAGYIWSRRLLENYGNPNTGAAVFNSKKCSVCHDNPSSGAPSLGGKGEYFSGATMVSVLTRHGPTMLDRMREKHLSWPRFSSAEMADLIAYLNSRGSKNVR